VERRRWGSKGAGPCSSGHEARTKRETAEGLREKKTPLAADAARGSEGRHDVAMAKATQETRPRMAWHAPPQARETSEKSRPRRTKRRCARAKQRECDGDSRTISAPKKAKKKENARRGSAAHPCPACDRGGRAATQQPGETPTANRGPRKRADSQKGTQMNMMRALRVESAKGRKAGHGIDVTTEETAVTASARRCRRTGERKH